MGQHLYSHLTQTPPDRPQSVANCCAGIPTRVLKVRTGQLGKALFRRSLAGFRITRSKGGLPERIARLYFDMYDIR